jgi:LysR family transcriptional regulator, nitrogen assimilation regulatory protein
MTSITGTLYLSEMETRALRYFQTVAECGSYSRGAELLRISQPAVSRQIGKLEEDIGVRLFRRLAHGVSLTDAGQVLLRHCHAALRELEQARVEIRNGVQGPSGSIAFAVPPAAAHFLVPVLMQRFSLRYPNVFLKLAGGFSGHIHEWLIREQVDIACLHDPLPQKGFEITPLLQEEVFLVGRPDAVPTGRRHLRIADLPSVPLILPSRPNASRRLLDNWVARTGVTLNIRAEVDDHLMIRALIRAGIGCSLLTHGAFAAELARGEVAAVAFRPRAWWPLAVVRASAATRSEILEAFHQMVCAVAHDLAKTHAWPGAKEW